MTQARTFLTKKKNDVVYDGVILSSITKFQELLREECDHIYVIGKFPVELEIFVFTDDSAIFRIGRDIGLIEDTELVDRVTYEVEFNRSEIKSFLLAKAVAQ